MSDPILLFLGVDAAALLLLGLSAAALPLPVCTFLATMASGLGVLLCLPPLLLRTPGTILDLPMGPPGLSLHLALDPLAAFFLVFSFLAGTAITAFLSIAVPMPGVDGLRHTLFCLAGTTMAILAADGVTLTVGIGIACVAGNLRGLGRYDRAVLLAPFLLLAAICLLTPSGFAPRFDTIRAAPADPTRASFAAALTLAAVMTLPLTSANDRRWAHDALAAGLLIPAGSYLLLRVVADLAGGTPQTGVGFLLLLAGGAIAIIQGWRGASMPEIDRAVAALTHRQTGLAIMGIGLALVARAADLPGAETFALGATFLTTLGSSISGVLASLATHVIGTGAATNRLSRLGGLVHTMPATSAALTIGLVGLCALPPGLGFATLWLLFEAILSSPRTGGLVFQLPLALTGAVLALSTALTTAALTRMIGIGLLGRPRTPRGAGAREATSPCRIILLALATLSGIAGVLPGAALWLLANPAIYVLTEAPPGAHRGWALMVPPTSSPSYLALPVLAILTLATGAAILASRWSRKESKPIGPWTGGMKPPVGLPFGEPGAQSIGEGFVPALPAIRLPGIPTLALPRTPFRHGIWLLIAASALLLACLALAE